MVNQLQAAFFVIWWLIDVFATQSCVIFGHGFFCDYVEDPFAAPVVWPPSLT
jgi:hypothetical protein